MGSLAETGFLLDQEGGHVLVDRVVALVALAEHRHQSGGGSVGQPHLLTRDRVAAVSLLRGLRAHRGHVGPKAGFRHREGAAHLSGRHPREILRLLLLGAVLHQQIGHDEVRVDDTRHTHPAAGDLLDHQGVGQQRLAEATELLGDGQAEDAQLLEPLDDLGRVLIGMLQLLGHRDDLLVDVLANGLEDLGLVLVESVGLTEAGHAYFLLVAGETCESLFRRRHDSRVAGTV